MSKNSVLGSKRIAGRQRRAKVVTEARAEVSTRCAIYLRVSTEEQAERGHGLDSQGRACRAFAESQGYEVAATATDPGQSGATRPADRPGFGELVALAGAGGFAVLILYKFDRLARHIGYSIEAVGQLEAVGVVVRSVTEPIDTGTPMGRTIFAIFAGMAEQERRTITERTHGGRREKATKGGRACGAAPFGYRAADGGLVVDEAEADVVRRIFAMRAEDPRPRLEDIADRLNADGVKGRRGGRWRKGRIAYLLDNPAYRGVAEFLFTWGGAEAHVLRKATHRAIIGGKP